MRVFATVAMGPALFGQERVIHGYHEERGFRYSIVIAKSLKYSVL